MGCEVLLISLPADFTTRIHSVTKIMIPVDLASGPESGGTAVAIPGVEWKGLRDIELLKVLWGILLKAHFVMRYLFVRYVFTLFRRVRLDFPVIPGLTGNLVHRLS